jgi:hypothetical protein
MSKKKNKIEKMNQNLNNLGSSFHFSQFFPFFTQNHTFWTHFDQFSYLVYS